MLRINLLPPYIYDNEKKIPWIIGSLSLIPITLGLMLWWNANAQAALDAALKRKSDANDQQTQYTSLVNQIKAEQAAVAVTKSKEDFVANSIKYNEAWPKVYTAMRDVTSNKVLLKSMYVTDDRKAINFAGFCGYEGDLVRWWMFLREQTALFTDVHFRLPDHAFVPQAATAAAGGGRGMAMSGGPMGSGGSAMGMPSSGGAMGMPSASGMGSSGGPSGGSSGMSGGSFGGGSGGADAIGDTEIEGRKGINFTASATLKQPLAMGIPTPGWSSAGAPASGGASPSGGGPMNSGALGMGSPSGK